MKRKTKLLFGIILAGRLLSACTDHIVEGNHTPDTTEEIDHAPRELSVRLNKHIVAELNGKQREVTVPTGSSQLDKYMREMGAARLTRIFPYAGKDETLQQREGLNLWYTMLLTKTPASITRTVSEASRSNVTTFVEPVYISKLEKSNFYSFDVALTQANVGNSPFNDPLYSRQWDLRNQGNIGNYVDKEGNRIVSSIAGADINIEPAWAVTTGRKEVIVAVVDGGIDTNHPDLQGSFWINKDEIPGNGIDDDNNGYIDDYYGYNFVDDKGIITPTRHGTHVAGTIAARNNNGRGVCGIAGGDGRPESGARIMCCQIFKNNPNYDPNDPESTEEIGTGSRNLDAAAIVYGANNGAVISQNSWGYSLGHKATPQVVKEAIAYFNKYAGGNKTEIPLIKGGIVIFAAGNDATQRLSYPAADENVISVAAFNPDFQASWYTNYGETVDIAAPGGSQTVKGKYPREGGVPTSLILSTIPPTADGKNAYAYLQGTSMACPHVSGIAALIVSKYGSASFTADKLRQRLFTGIKQMNYNDYVNKSHFDGLGLGYVDAMAALSDYDMNIEPVVPQFLPEKSKRGYNTVTVAWKSSNKGSDGSLQHYVLYISNQPITPSNYTNANRHIINANYAEAEDVFERTNNRAATGTTYYFAVQAIARNGKASPIAILPDGVATLPNEAPKIKADIPGNRIKLAGRDHTDVTFTITDKENHSCTYRTEGAGSIDIKHEGNKLTMHIDASKFMPGIYPVTLTVEDEYGASTSFTLIVEIFADKVPELKDNINPVNIKLGEHRTIRLTDWFDDEQSDKLVFKVKHNDAIDVNIAQGTMTITGKQFGESTIELLVTDVHGQTGSFTIPVFVYLKAGIYAVYPTIATTTLYIKVGQEVTDNAEIIIRNMVGKEVLRKPFNVGTLERRKRTLLLDISNLARGSYIVSLLNHDKTYQDKFVKK